MIYKFDNNEIIQYDTRKFGKGKGIIVGHSKETGQYIVQSKVKYCWPGYPFQCFLVKPKNLISTPF